MSRTLLRLARLPVRTIHPSPRAFRIASRCSIASNRGPIRHSLRAFSTSVVQLKGLSPESEDPKPKEPEDHHTSDTPTEITADEYHELADTYLERIIAKFEEIQEKREDVDVEYSAGVLTLTFPPNGSYVINKQPPNKQIWLSSPISGPKRYDWVVSGEGQHEKHEGGSGDWIYLRDGTSLSEVLSKELQVDLVVTIEHDHTEPAA